MLSVFIFRYLSCERQLALHRFSDIIFIIMYTIEMGENEAARIFLSDGRKLTGCSHI